MRDIKVMSIRIPTELFNRLKHMSEKTRFSMQIIINESIEKVVHKYEEGVKRKKKIKKDLREKLKTIKEDKLKD